MIHFLGSHTHVFAPLVDLVPAAEPAPAAGPAVLQGFGDHPVPQSVALQSMHRRDVACGPDRTLGAGARLELRYLATSAFNKIRSHFRSGDKSSNKVRLPRDESDSRGLVDILRWLRADDALFQLRETRAPLAERSAARVGNCDEMSRLAVDEARKLGLRAHAWGFVHEGKPASHAFALVDLPRDTLSSAYAVGDTRRNFDGGDDFWIVDPWAGICCPGSKYDALFVAKMDKWAAQNKHIFHQGEWRVANDFTWLQATLGNARRLLAECPIPDHAIRA
jgi:hypothetical protein